MKPISEESFIYKHRNWLLRLMDIVIIVFSYILAKAIFNQAGIRFSYDDVRILRNTILLAIIIFELVMQFFRTYKNLVSFEGGMDYVKYVLASIITCASLCIINVISTLDINSVRINILASVLISMFTVSYRVVYRFIRRRAHTDSDLEGQDKKNVLIIGAGEAAKQLLDNIRNTMNAVYNVVGLIDDNNSKKSYIVSGKKILGNRYEIPRICQEQKVDVIFFTISNIGADERKKILEICQETKCKVRILPGTKDLIRNKPLMSNLRDVSIEDLLGRESIKLDNKNIHDLINGRCILVTGGGGSIGSELCRQIIKNNPSKLVILDIYENSLYDIEQELKFNYPKSDIQAVVASVRDIPRLEEVFKEYKPYLVFHAAAHKHVPLMEGSPLEAIKNNVFGTYNTVNMADKYGVKRFVLISTDKAVNPTNIMGATKRLCEMIIQAKAKESKTEFVAVRFGNVLGSNGSVIPLFKKQIAAGGPVTVTHKEITRFFMTIPEAVSLVLQAMSYATGGEIFVLDMGEPVKIYDMAVKLIRLSGYEPNVDMQIKVTGLRPGEKLYEEVLMDEEGLTETKHDKIHIAKPSNITVKDVDNKLDKLNKLLDEQERNQAGKQAKNIQYDGVDKVKIKKVMMDIVPTFKPSEYNYNSNR